MRPIASKDQSYKRQWGQHFGAIQGQFDQKIITTFLTRARRSAGHITGLECAGPVGLGVLIAKSLIKRDSSSPIFCILLIGSRNAAPAKAQKLTGS